MHDGTYSAFRKRRFGAPADDIPPERFVVFSRRPRPGRQPRARRPLPVDTRPLAAFCTLLSPFTPMLFQGEEYGERAPFQFFTDHIDPEIADATREGRRREFASFAEFSGEEVPDPQDVATFERSKLTREGEPEGMLELHARLLRARRDLLPPGDVDDVDYDERAGWLAVRRGECTLLTNFARTSTTSTATPCASGSARCAEHWVRDFHFDGLRLDAIHAIVDSSPEHLVAEVARRVHAINPGALVIAESGLNDPKVMRVPELGGYGCDAAWADDFHHALRVLLTGETEGWYGEFDSMALLAKAFKRPHVHDGTYSAVPQAPLRGARRRRPAGALRRLLAPTTTRSATAPSATVCRSTRGRWPPSARSCHPSRPCCSRARNTASGRRFSSSRITSTPRSPTPPARAAGASSPRSPRSAARRCPIRRTSPPSSAPS